MMQMQLVHLSHSCAQMITFYSDNPVLNPAEVYSFHCIPKLFRIEPKNEKVAHTLSKWPNTVCFTVTNCTGLSVQK